MKVSMLEPHAQKIFEEIKELIENNPTAALANMLNPLLPEQYRVKLSLLNDSNIYCKTEIKQQRTSDRNLLQRAREHGYEPELIYDGKIYVYQTNITRYICKVCEWTSRNLGNVVKHVETQHD